jgi:tRNA dimethylallyltransferase
LSDTASQAIGYSEAFAVLDGAMTEKQAKEQTCIRTRRLAKRQMTWFRNQLDVAWVDMDENTTIEQAAQKVQQTWHCYGAVELRTLNVER